MDDVDRKLLVEAEKGLLLTAEPFSEIAAKVGITAQEAIVRLQKLQSDGVIRRFGASLKPSGVGFCANALVAWKVPDQRVTAIAAQFSACKEISHCYERRTIAGRWEYNVYTVVHAHEREAIERFVKHLSDETGLNDFLVLYSTRNLKTQQSTET